MSEIRWETESGVLLSRWMIASEEQFSPGIRACSRQGEPMDPVRVETKEEVTRFVFPDDVVIVPA